MDKALASNEASRKTATRQSTRREDGGGDKNGGSYGSTGGNGGKSDEKDDGVIRVLVPKDPKFFSDTTDFLIGALFILGITIGKNTQASDASSWEMRASSRHRTLGMTTDYKCENRQEVDELGCDIGAV